MHNTFFKVVNLPQNKRQKAIIKIYIVLKKKKTATSRSRRLNTNLFKFSIAYFE